MIELSLDFHGFPIIIADTAGLRSTSDEVEAIGVARAQSRASTADIKLCLLSIVNLFSSSTSNSPSDSSAPLSATIDPLTMSLIDHNTIIVLSKADSFALTKDHREALKTYLTQQNKTWLGRDEDVAMLEVSVKDSTGLDELVGVMAKVLKSR